jgi:hypothetical protein
MMRDLLIEQLTHIIHALPAGMTFQDWYDDACSFEHFTFGDPIQREAVSFAYGYLRGAHEACDVTMMELLDEHDIDPDALTKRAARSARKRQKG